MCVQGKSIRLRTAEVIDAKFVLDLRTNPSKVQFLNKIESDLAKQQAWLKEYKKRELLGMEYYFIIESNNCKPLGLVRIYDLQEKSFCWGSWLIKESAPAATAIESALLIYEFAFNQLNYNQSHFDVRKGNERVIAFHKRFGATVQTEDELNYYFKYSKASYLNVRKKYKRFLK
jgi:RimJ/RimL family protein N-acetyltransferase